MTTPASEPLLSIRGLEVSFKTQRGPVPVLHGVDLDVFPGETVAIVGESGSGKSTTAHAVIDLLPGSGRITGGSIRFDGEELTSLPARAMERLRGRSIGFVPQDPMSNLNPVWSIGFQVRETIRANGLATRRRDVDRLAVEVLQKAGLEDAERRLGQFPHQFSGGMRQRALIGIGLSSNPRLLIADEPTSALDVTVQRRILDHLASLTGEAGTAVLFITHDLGLAAERAERIIVMYRGRVVEAGPSLAVLQHPKHPYTQRLIAAAPSLASRRIGGDASVGAELDVTTSIDLTHAADVHERALIEATDPATPVGEAEPLISVRDLTKVYRIRKGSFRAEQLRAVDSVSFDVPRGSTLALVGESGSGKSTIAKMLLQLEQPTSGTIDIEGVDYANASRKDVFALRRRLQPVFQDPYGSLDPLRNIGSTIAEPLVVHGVGDAAERRARVVELLEQVALPTMLASRYPNELSGGQRQRVAIARALALRPEIVVFDEAVSALDVLVQAQVLNLLAELQRELGLTYVFITHDLAVVRVIADRVAVMQRGRLVETATVAEVFDAPRETYTQELLAAIPGSGIDLARG